MPEAIEEVIELIQKDDTIFSHKVILFNDDYNTFNHVEDCLMRICHLSLQKAKKIAMEAHTKGKAVCYTGSLEECETVAEKLSAENLTVACE
ncbi:MAG: ATP-dependent Clp protease adaptor ClpS [Leptospiraceae bacterium]|nr:ATP-dependent Clp protease adaptor ClpS [Leptospiraceae bacterium]